MSDHSKTRQQIMDCIEDTITAMDIDLVDIEYVKEGKEWVLRIFIDKTGGVSLDDCSDVSLAIEPILDSRDIIRNHYNLEVSSPGLDRPLITQKDFDRAAGQLVEVHPVHTDGIKEWYEGKLQSVTPEDLVIILDEPYARGIKPKTNGQEKRFRREEIKTVRKAVRI